MKIEALHNVNMVAQHSDLLNFVQDNKKSILDYALRPRSQLQWKQGNVENSLTQNRIRPTSRAAKASTLSPRQRLVPPTKSKGSGSSQSEGSGSSKSEESGSSQSEESGSTHSEQTDQILTPCETPNLRY